MKNLMTKTTVLAAALSAIHSAWAQEEVSKESMSALEEVVITGTRGQPRTVMDSAVPVDIFSSEDIKRVSHTDTQDVLMTLAPSYTVNRQPISDGSTFIRPASLRGLPTDKTLVLVNSKRRHRASLVTIGGSGTQGPDIATIPVSALKNVEVLRDGAAAQYGSDAIAGVINFILKDNSEGGSLSFNSGEYFEGDGTQYTVSGNIGLPLGDSGFLSISGEVYEQDYTSRSEQYCESWFCVTEQSPEFQEAAKNASLESDVVQPWGSPNTSATRLFFNAALPLSSGTELYAFGNYSESEADGGFFYRYPGNGTIEDLRNADGSIYNPIEKFPGGFTPRFFGDVTDYSLVGGVRGTFASDISYDVSARMGYNEISYTLKNTINPSLGADSPTSFRPGDLSNEEIQLQADFSKELSVGLSSPATLAFGLSYLDETYDITPGEESAYIAGPHAVSDPYGFCNNDGTTSAAGLSVIAGGSSLNCANPSDPVYRVVGVGSNGFPGFSPEFSEDYSRDSYGAYVDLSADVTDDLFLQGAIRYEDYSDMGSEVVGKVAFQYDISETFGLRGSAGTGFRAPTPGQQGTTNVSTRLPNGFPVATGLFPASSAVAQALGAEDLKAETSTNFTLGFTVSTDFMSLTVDYYRIEIDDRTNAISTQDVSTDPASGAAYDNYLALSSAGVVGAESIGGVFYFQNAFDTSTQGVDVVATMPIEWSNGSVTDFSMSLNYNETQFESDPSAYLNAEDTFDFENLDPNLRAIVSAGQQIGPVYLFARANYFGASENYNAGQVQEFDPIVFVDLEARVDITSELTLSLGGRNIFDEYPDKDEISDYCCGRIYSSASVVDWQGGFYYLRADYNF